MKTNKLSSNLRALISCLALLTGAARAGQVVMDFDHLTTYYPAEVHPILAEDGLRLNYTATNGSTPFTWYIFGPGSDRNTGHKALHPTWSGTTTSLTAAGGGPFTLVSIRLSPIFNGSTGTVTFTGTKSNNTTVTQTFTTGTVVAGVVRTFPAGFQNVVSVSWQSLGNGNDFHQFDDITAILPPQIRVTPPQTVTENSGSVTVGLSLSEPLATPLNMSYLATNGTALATTDFLANGQTGSTFVIPAGQTSWSLNVDVIDDTTVEALEQFTFGFSTTATNVAFADGVSSTTIKIASEDGVTGFPGWMSAHGLTANDALPNADPNGDGISNIETWLCRINPAGPSPAVWRERRATFIFDAANRPALRLFVPNPLPTDVRITFEETTVLSSWTMQAQRTGWGVTTLWTGAGSARVVETVVRGEKSIVCSGSQNRTARPKAWLRMKYDYVTGGGID